MYCFLYKKCSIVHVPTSGVSGRASPSVSALYALNGGLQTFQTLTNLEAFDVREVRKLFEASADKHGCLDFPGFMHCMRKLIKRSGALGIGAPDEALHDRAKRSVRSLFDLFDADGSGYVNFAELVCGLSVICGGAQDPGTRARTIFSLIERDGDGYVSLHEMESFLTSVFKVTVNNYT